MNDTQSNNIREPDSLILSIEDLQQRVEEHYIPLEPGEERWFRCQREMDDTRCAQKVFFPSGVRAHENHHSIEAGRGPLISENHPAASEREGVDQNDADDGVTDNELLDDISSEFDGLE